MQKQDYERIAAVIKARREPHVRPDPYDEDLLALDVIDALTLSLADEFTSFHALFDRGKFLAACGVEP